MPSLGTPRQGILLRGIATRIFGDPACSHAVQDMAIQVLSAPRSTRHEPTLNADWDGFGVMSGHVIVFNEASLYRHVNRVLDVLFTNLNAPLRGKDSPAIAGCAARQSLD